MEVAFLLRWGVSKQMKKQEEKKLLPKWKDRDEFCVLLYFVNIC